MLPLPEVSSCQVSAAELKDLAAKVTHNTIHSHTNIFHLSKLFTAGQPTITVPESLLHYFINKKTKTALVKTYVKDQEPKLPF
jgi:hypothetical protein